MTRCSMVLLLASSLSACAGWPEPFARSGAADGPGWPDMAGGSYDFDWHLSGDRAVAPLQVFDDGRDTWLQFPPGQALPAIFGVRDGVERLLPYRRQDPYLHVAGQWQGLVLRGGALSARADYQGANLWGRNAAAEAVDTAPAWPQAAWNGGNAQPARNAGERIGGHAGKPAAPAQALPVVQAEDETASRPAAQGDQATRGGMPAMAIPEPPPKVSAAASPQTAGTAPGFSATPADANMRRALARWARSAQWTFEPEHWTPDVDIPLAGSADFSTDFKQAVRQLLAATELSERPLQPCFYSNRVLRVVPLAQACDRTARHMGATS